MHESVSTKLKSLVGGREEEGGRGGSSNQDFLDLKKEIDLIKIQLNQLIRENNLLKQIHNENNQKVIKRRTFNYNFVHYVDNSQFIN